MYSKRSAAGSSTSSTGLNPATQTGQRPASRSERVLHPSLNRMRRWPLTEESNESSVKQSKISQDGRYVVVLLSSGVVQVYNTGKGTVQSLWSAGHRVSCISLWCPPKNSCIQESLTELSQLNSFSDTSDANSDVGNDLSDDEEDVDSGKEQWISQLHSAHVCLLAAGTEKGQVLVWNLDSKADGGSRHSRSSYGSSVRSNSGIGNVGWRRRCAIRSILKKAHSDSGAGSREPRTDIFQVAKDTINSAIIAPIGSLTGLRKKEVVITIKEEASPSNGEVTADLDSSDPDATLPESAAALTSANLAETQRFWLGNKPHVFANPAGLVSNITAVQFTPDGFFVVTGGGIGDVLLWDVSPEGADGAPKVLGAGEGRPVLSLDVDAMANGRGYWFGLAIEAEVLQVWEVRDHRKTGLERSSVQTLGQEGEYPVTVHLRTLEGGPVQVLAGYDALWEQVAQKEIKVWERAPRSLTQNLWSWSEAHYMTDVTAVSLAAEPGKVLTISEDGAVLTVWDATSLAPLYTKVMESSRFAWQHCAISSDGDHILGIDDGGNVMLIPWNGHGFLIHEAPAGMHLSCMCVSWCGHFMACGGWRNDEVTRELVKCVAVFRWLEEERRWADRLTPLPPQLGSVERMELSPDGRWLLTSHSGSGGVRDDAVAAWWIRGGRCDLRWAKKLDGEVTRIQFSHDGRIASVVVKQGLATVTETVSSTPDVRSEVHLWAVSEWPAGRAGTGLDSPSVNSRTSGGRSMSVREGSENGSENGSESSEALFTMSTQPPSVVLKHEDGFQSASFRQGPAGPELMCVNGERRVTLYQEEGPLIWTPFELLCLGPNQKIISCAAADGIDGSTALLVTETSCKSSKLWVMGPHSAEEGPGGGPYIGTMQRARLNTRFNRVVITPSGDAIICLGPGEAQAYDIHTLEPLWWSPMIPPPIAKHFVSASNAIYKRVGTFDGEARAPTAFVAAATPGTPSIKIIDLTLLSTQQPSFSDALRGLRSLQPQGSNFAYSPSSLGAGQGGDRSAAPAPLQSGQLPTREMDFMRQLLARYPCVVNLREKGIVSWRLPPTFGSSARAISSRSSSRASRKSAEGDPSSSVGPQGVCSLSDLLQQGVPTRGDHLTLIAVAVALRGGDILEVLLEEHSFASGGEETDGLRTASFNTGELLPDQGHEKPARIPPPVTLDFGRIAWVDWHGRERVGDVLELAVDRGDLQAVAKLLEAIPLRTSAYSRGGLIRGLIAVAASYPSMMAPLLDVLGLGPSLPQVVEGVEWAVLQNESLTLASDRISERGLWESYLLEQEGLIERHSHPSGCRCGRCLLKRVKCMFRRNRECHVHFGHPRGKMGGGGQPVEARMVRLRTLSLADYRVNLFWAIVRYCTGETARDVFTTAIMRALLTHKWNAYGRWIVTRTVVLYTIYLLLFLIVVLVPQSTRNMGTGCTAGTVSYISGTTLVVFHVGILIKYRRTWFSKQGQPRTVALVWFLNNFMTTATVALIWASMHYRGSDGRGQVPPSLVAATNVVSAVSALLICLRGLWFFTSFSMFGPLVSLLIEVVFDIRAFLVVLLLVLLSFSLSYTLLYAGGMAGRVQAHCGASYNAFSSWPRSAVYLFQSMFGQVDMCPFINAEPRVVQYASVILFIVFMLVVAVIMLTVLIAIISRTFDRMRKQAEVHFLRGRAQMLFLIETNLSTAQRCNPEWFPAWLHILVPRDMTLKKGSVESSRPILQRSRSKKEEKFRVSRQLDGLEEKLAALSSVVRRLAEGGDRNAGEPSSSGRPLVSTTRSLGPTLSNGEAITEVFTRRPSHGSSAYFT